MGRVYKSRRGPGMEPYMGGPVVEITPESAGWKYLGFRVIGLKAGEIYRELTGSNEVALVPLNGSASVQVGDSKFEMERHNIFAQIPEVLYVPPRQEIVATATSNLLFSTGGAPAVGRYPTRLFKPQEMKQEVRGGGAARRQVNHILAHPMPAERLILYEVYVPGGEWSGWPPHCHDGYQGSPYLEETYYYRFDTKEGFGIQRNYRDEDGLDEVFVVHDGDLTLVSAGYHPVVAAPGSNMYFLNYEAGDLLDGGRGTAPYEDPSEVWIKGDWEKHLLKLPIGKQ